MKKLITHALIMLMCTAFALHAASAMASGLYYDADRDGEGLMLMRDGERVVGYFYTYGGLWCGEVVRPPVVSPAPPVEPIPECDLNAQRWFFFADPFVEKVGAAGILYASEGVNYPDGEFDETNPFGVIVGKVFPVGTYFLRPWEDGYQMVVVPPDGTKPDDPLYQRVFNFTTLLFKPKGE